MSHRTHTNNNPRVQLLATGCRAKLCCSGGKHVVCMCGERIEFVMSVII